MSGLPLFALSWIERKKGRARSRMGERKRRGGIEDGGGVLSLRFNFRAAIASAAAEAEFAFTSDRQFGIIMAKPR